ncbi:mucosal addressin cell adhesion molecule 1 [Heterocephalus glaber]|uniref:Mucosal addressin cell adhesion molecule 1 n=1 Tax=Heterocephalus glaber TaxID=10181 RepID=A0AAX6Q5R8_HETGA|nr:mucosal addressin cell adhesion molecule 1 [Heterocephalus glaber]
MLAHATASPFLSMSSSHAGEDAWSRSSIRHSRPTSSDPAQPSSPLQHGWAGGGGQARKALGNPLDSRRGNETQAPLLKRPPGDPGRHRDRMLWGLELLLALSLGLLRPGRGQPLLVEPPEPVVVVALGTAQQLTCSLACAHGTAAVHWRGLDTSLGTVRSEPGRSVLWLRSASLADAGTRVCRGSCGSRTFQHLVEVLVYAFPDQLTVSPATLEPGRDREVACTAHSVTPQDPDTLSFSLLLGDQELEGLQALGREEAEEEAAVETEDPLFWVTQRWLLPTLSIPAPATLHCQATMQLPGLELSHRQPLPVLHSPTSPETPSPTSLKPSDLTSLEPPDFISTAHPNSIISVEPPYTPSPQATPEQAPSPSPHSPHSCRPEIRQVPTAATEAGAGWGLLCQATCGSGVAVRWTLAPGGLDAYKRRMAGAWAWLGAPLLTNSSPEGWFQCRLEPGGQVANLYVQGRNADPSTSSSPEVVQPSEALWMGSVALGLLLLLALGAYCLRKHCWPAARDLSHPSVSLGLLHAQDSAG